MAAPQPTLVTLYLSSSGLELKYKGSDAVERKGVYYAISDRDHPAATLMQIPNKISRGMAAQISLNIRKVCDTLLILFKRTQHQHLLN